MNQDANASSMPGDADAAAAAAQHPARKPRTMGDKPPASPASPSPAQVARVAATPEPARQPRTMAAGTPAVATAAQQPATPFTPKPMPGKVRMGLKVKAEDLRRRFPEQTDATLAAVSVFLGGIVASTVDWTRAQSLGLDLQQRYGSLVQQLLDTASSDVLRTAPQHLLRLISLLEACAEDLQPATGLGGWLRKDRGRALDQHRKEIEQLKTRLSAQMLALEAPMAQVIRIRAQLTTLADELMVAGLGCDWLFDDGSVDADVRTVLADRALALTKTAGLVRQQQAQSLATANQVDALRDRIQDGVLIALPTWLAQLASLPAELNETQRFGVRDELGQILNRLKS